MMNRLTIQPDNGISLQRKVEFLKRPETYGDTSSVKALETHMSWVFLTDHNVFKLKKPVQYDFLDFSTVASRHKFCMEEVKLNQQLASDTYVGVVGLNMDKGSLQLNGKGEVVDWLVKMKRLPEEFMLHKSIANDSIRFEYVVKAAELLTNFYLNSPPVRVGRKRYQRRLIEDIEKNGEALLRREFELSRSLIMTDTTALLHFVTDHADLFDGRIAGGKIVDGHGDLRPEHICAAPKPVVIDRLEFDKNLRIIDVAEELSSLALECEILGSPAIGHLFLSIYKCKSGDNIPDCLVLFYKAKRALLRARLSIYHILEEEYSSNTIKWRNRCDNYLLSASNYCSKFKPGVLN
jgi:uncharacterized protein